IKSQGAARRASARATIGEGKMSERAQQGDDADATVVLPTPGRKRSAFAPSIERHAAAADLAALGGLNPLVEAANPILAAVPQIRHALRHPDPAGLRARLRAQIDGFQSSYRSGEGGRQALTQARTKLYEFIEQRQGKKSTELSARWRGANVRARRVPSALAIWGAASACALLLAGLYFGYSVLLGARS